MPRAAKVLETDELPVGQQKPRIMKSTGPASIAIEEPELPEAEMVIDQEWADNMAFNAEKVTFVVNESTEAGVDNPVICGNSGNARQFWRGIEYTEERRFLESLMRAKITRYSQRKVVDPQGIESYQQIPHTACRYDIRVLHDPHPKGHEWLKSIRLQP